MLKRNTQINRCLLVVGMVITLLLSQTGFSLAQEIDPGAPLTPAAVEDQLPVYLPAISRPAPAPLPAPPQSVRVNAPFYDGGTHFSDAAIFWLGEVTPSENYADVRVYYTPEALFVRVSVFDRLLYSDNTPSATELLDWDAVSVMLDLENAGSAPGTNTYRFDVQVNNQPTNMENFRASFRGNGTNWALAAVDFNGVAGFRWESSTVGGINTGLNNRGWQASYVIPFTSLGLPGAPLEGTMWKLGVAVHDRESLQQASQDVNSWPSNLDANTPTSWGELRYGLPQYSPPASPEVGMLTVRNGLNGTHVQDAAVGGTIGNLCPGDPVYIWNYWGNANYGDDPSFNVQNQADLADWPCFSKYFINFPLNQMLPGKVILHAELTVYLFGNSDPNYAQDTLVQILAIDSPWDENTITWNNAPMAAENVSQVFVLPSDYPWPRIPYTFDVTRAVAQVYANQTSLNLALYSADGAPHSGKYFVGADDVYVNGDFYRPTLEITWGDP
jgi:hypothetical protein